MKQTITSTQIIAKEGYKYAIVSAIVLALALYWGFGLLSLAILCCAAAAVIAFFRNPERIAEDDCHDAIISPVDGIITSIDREFEERFINDECVSVTFSTSLYDTHFLRSPFATALKKRFSLHGLYLPIKNEKAKFLNERFSAFFENDMGIKSVVSVTAGTLATRMSLYAADDTNVRQAQRLAFLKSEFQTVLYLPKEIAIQKAVGDKVRAGETMIGRFLAQ